MKEVFEVPESKDMVLQGDYDNGMNIKGVRSVAFNTEDNMAMETLSPPPHYGAHTREVMQKWLGYEEKDIKALISKGVIYAREK